MRKILIAVLAIVMLLSLSGCAFTQWFSTWRNTQVDYIDQKIEDKYSYETKKEVEDACRAMIASYETDKLTYEQYIDSDNEEKVGWAESAKLRANRTATNYNNYVLKNSFVWDGNIPEDILNELPIIP